MNENKNNGNSAADNDKPIDEIISGGYISDLFKKYNVPEDEPAESDIESLLKDMDSLKRQYLPELSSEFNAEINAIKEGTDSDTPSMRIVYQSPDSINPEVSAPSSPESPQACMDDPQPVSAIPDEQKAPPAPAVKDYLANMRVIYEAPEDTLRSGANSSYYENKDSAGDIPPALLMENKNDYVSDKPSSEQPDNSISSKNSLADLFSEANNKETKNEKAKSRIKRIFPCKGDGVAESIRKIVLMISIITMFVCGGILLNTYIIAPYFSSQQSEKAVKSKINSSHTKDWSTAKDKYANVNFPKGMQLKYADLYVTNRDFAGWLEIPGIGVDMPVVKGKDNEVYLKKTFYGEKSKYGCVFVDYRNTIDPLNRNTILYGHNMSYNDLMFGKLEAYRNIDSFKASPLIKFNTLFKDYTWKIYAVFITNSNKSDDDGYVFDYVYTELGSDNAFQSYIKAIDQRKLYTTGVDILPSDKILTLSTCCYDFDDARFVVIARMVRPGESDKVDTSKASVNSNPRYPQAWYSAKGKSNPFSGAEKWIPN